MAYGCVNAAGLLFPDLAQAGCGIFHLRVESAPMPAASDASSSSVSAETMKTREKEAAMSNAVAR